MSPRHRPERGPTRARRAWTLLTNHGACLVFVARRPDATLREIGDAVGITERTAARIVRDLRDAGYVTARRLGRSNVYALNPEAPLREAVGEDKPVVDLLDGIVDVDRVETSIGTAVRHARARREQAAELQASG